MDLIKNTGLFLSSLFLGLLGLASASASDFLTSESLKALYSGAQVESETRRGKTPMTYKFRHDETYALRIGGQESHGRWWVEKPDKICISTRRSGQFCMRHKKTDNGYERYSASDDRKLSREWRFIMTVGSQTGNRPSTKTAGSVGNLKVSFGDPSWNGKQIPSEHTCPRDGGSRPRTPKLIVENVPPEANALIVEFNDRDSDELATDGGHGKVGYWINGSGRAVLRSIRAYTGKPRGRVWIEANHRSDARRPGYVPPCSGGRGNSYFADVKAVFKSKDSGEILKILATGSIELGTH